MKDAIAVLLEDHKNVLELLDRYEMVHDHKERENILHTVMTMLLTHDYLERVVIYPQILKAHKDLVEKYVKEIEDEMQKGRHLPADHRRLSTIVKKLREAFIHHVKDEI
eukprot:tig00021434_g21323.t1